MATLTREGVEELLADAQQNLADGYLDGDDELFVRLCGDWIRMAEALRAALELLRKGNHAGIVAEVWTIITNALKET